MHIRAHERYRGTISGWPFSSVNCFFLALFTKYVELTTASSLLWGQSFPIPASSPWQRELGAFRVHILKLWLLTGQRHNNNNNWRAVRVGHLLPPFQTGCLGWTLEDLCCLWCPRRNWVNTLIGLKTQICQRENGIEIGAIFYFGNIHLKTGVI